MSSKQVQSVQDQEFRSKVEASKGLALVDFWAEWCGPCKALAPVIDRLATENEGQLTVFKMDVDANPDTASRFHIRGIPTVILFKDGKPVDQIVGSAPLEVFQNAVRKHLN